MQHKTTPLISFTVLAMMILPAAAQQLQDAARSIVATPVVDTNPGANLPAQAIGPDDLLSLQVYDAPEFSRTVRVSSDGTIRLPMLKSTVRVEGLFPKDIETLVAEALLRDKLLVDPFVTVNVVDYHSRPISITGAVRTPTIFQAIGTVTLLDALARAGGLVPDQAGAEILITKPNGDTNVQSIQRIPVKALISGTEPELNVKLTGGETIRVPDVGKYMVAGSVSHPGLYPVIDGNANTVITAIAQAQGTIQYYSHTAYLYRPDPDGKGAPHEIQIKLGDILQRKAPDVAILPRDVLYIPDSSGRRIADRTATALTSVAGGAAIALTYVLR
jgi:polysaccharide export outer membrane protein